MTFLTDYWGIQYHGPKQQRKDKHVSEAGDTEEERRRPAGRRAVISREHLIEAAIHLAGPNRSISTLSLREVARQAGIAPNSFYRHFKDVDELAVALIDESGQALRQIIGKSRHEVSSGGSVVRSCIEVFVGQTQGDEPFLPILLREGRVGSAAFKEAVERQLRFFEDELEEDLIRLSAEAGSPLVNPRLVSRAITRLVFAMGPAALESTPEECAVLIDEMVIMVRMIIKGAHVRDPSG